MDSAGHWSSFRETGAGTPLGNAGVSATVSPACILDHSGK